MKSLLLKILVKILPSCIRWYYDEERIKKSLLLKIGDRGVRLVNGATLISCHLEITNHLPFPISMDRLEAQFNLTGCLEYGVKLIPVFVSEHSTQYYPLDVSVSERNEEKLNSAELGNNHLQIECYLVSKIRSIVKKEHYSNFDISR